MCSGCVFARYVCLPCVFCVRGMCAWMCVLSARACVRFSSLQAITFEPSVQANFLPENGKKRKKSGGDLALRCEAITLDSIIAAHSRLDASRWFFEMLVLKTRDYVDLEQPTPYGDIIIRPCPKLMHRFHA